MLKRLSYQEQDGDWVSIEDASFPVPFAHGLEYNSPAHGPWNIVHMGMLVPGAHQIYVCGPNCVRGVVLTAAEMNAVDRFSTISIEEEDLFRGDTEDHIVNAVIEILDKLPYKPSAVLLFTVCVHHFMGCDIPYIYRELRRKRPDQIFVECYMDPIMQKEGLTPDQKLRDAMLTLLEQRPQVEKQISFVGSDYPVDLESELLSMICDAGWTYLDSADCDTFEEYQSLSASPIQIVTYPMAQYGGKRMADRLKKRYLYLPQTFAYQTIQGQMEILADAMGILPPDLSKDIEECEKMAQKARDIIGDTEIAIDMNAMPRYLGCARFFIEHGFRVTRLYGDAFSVEETEDFVWLQEHAPKIRVYPTIQTRMRVLHGSYGCKVLGIGQKAAYFTGSPYFVNMVEGGGYYGIRGLTRLMKDMIEAFQKPKELTIISRKGLGCECCI